MDILTLLWESYTTYPALPFIATGPLIVVMIIVSPIIGLVLTWGFVLGLLDRRKSKPVPRFSHEAAIQDELARRKRERERIERMMKECRGETRQLR